MSHFRASQLGILSLLLFLMVVTALPVLGSDRGEVYRHAKAATAVIIGLQANERREKDKAIEKFAAVLNSDPTSTTAAYHLGLALEAQGQERDALTHLGGVPREAHDDLGSG